MADVVAVIASTPPPPFYYRTSTLPPEERPPFAEERITKISAFRETLTRAEPDILVMGGAATRHPGLTPTGTTRSASSACRG